MRHLGVVVTLVLYLAVAPYPIVPTAHATTTCVFDIVASTMTLVADCTTDATISVPNGFTLDGAGHTITALDPTGGHFLGAVIMNGGGTAHVKNLTVTAANLANVCDDGVHRLRGIMFDGAGGSIVKNTVIGINQGNSGCQEGNAIEVRNAPFDDTHPSTKHVTIKDNYIDDYQKTGIVANGDVEVEVSNNLVGSADLENYLAANGIQLGFGGIGRIIRNTVHGNQWCGSSEYVATAILVYLASTGFTVSQNNVRGNADVGVYAEANNGTVDNNRIFDDKSIADCNAFGYDIGLGNYGTGNIVTDNKVGGYNTPYDGVAGGGNKTVPGGPID